MSRMSSWKAVLRLDAPAGSTRNPESFTIFLNRNGLSLVLLPKQVPHSAKLPPEPGAIPAQSHPVLITVHGLEIVSAVATDIFVPTFPQHPHAETKVAGSGVCSRNPCGRKMMKNAEL